MNKEASTVNGRLRHLVNIGASYDKAAAVAKEAVDSGIKLDMQSYIYLSTLWKPEIPKVWEALRQKVTADVEKWREEYVPEPDAIVQSLKDVRGPADVQLLHQVIDFVRQRKIKLNLDALQAIKQAHITAGEASNADSTIGSLHKEYLVDTPTFDIFSKQIASSS